jgi:hypothetical protein
MASMGPDTNLRTDLERLAQVVHKAAREATSGRAITDMSTAHHRHLSHFA